MTLPLVSVVIPTYNYARYIEQAIESVLGQSYPNIEIIVIDDGSTDNTASVVQKFGDKIQYHFQTNRGLPAARNRGIELSSGSYIQFLDSDDKLGPESIASKVKYLNDNPGVAYACSANRFFFDGKSALYNLMQNLLHGWRLPNERDILATLYYGNIAPPHAFLTRLELLKTNAVYFDESLKACEDYDFWLRLAAQFGAPGIVRQGFVYYRKHVTSMSSNQSNQLQHDAIMIERAFASHSVSFLPGNESDLEYMTANLAAALKNYYRLTRNNQHQYASAMRDHIDRLVRNLSGRVLDGRTRATRYRSEMRIFALKLSHENISLPVATDQVIRNLVGRRMVSCWRYFYENLQARSSMPELLNMVVLDVQFIYLRLTVRAGKNGKT